MEPFVDAQQVADFLGLRRKRVVEMARHSAGGENGLSEHYCEYDRNVPEPCGKVARFRVPDHKLPTGDGDLWLCAEHWNEFIATLKVLGVDTQELEKSI